MILSGLVELVSSQELSLFDNYLFSHIYNINPAAAGYDGAFKTSLAISKKWMGFCQSPSSQVFSNSIKLGDEGFYDDRMFLSRPLFNFAPRVGIGLSIFNESSGPLHHTGVLLAYSYHIRLKDKHISFGISVSGAQHYINTSEFQQPTMDDPVLNSENSSFIPDLNLGFMYYSQNWYLGFSGNGVINLRKTMDHLRNEPDIFVFGAYRYEINYNVSIEPSVFFHYTDYKYNMIDLNCRLRYHTNYWLLISCRLKREILGGIGLNVTDGVQLGYNYGMNTTPLSNYMKGSHSFSLFADIAILAQKIR